MILSSLLMKEEKKSGVLVHCMAGISRSASIVVAYLMKLNNWDVEKSLDTVKQSRKFIDPNAGFRRQLELYHRMKWILEGESKFHRIYRTQNLGYLRSYGCLPEMEALYENIFLKYKDSSSPSPSSESSSKENQTYACNICQTQLFSTRNIYDHSPMTLSNPDESQECPSFFLEPVSWMKPQINDHSGNLHCPKCSTVIGDFYWKGKRCTECNGKAKPSFRISKSNVS